MNHTIHKDRMHLLCIDLFGPGTALVVLGRVPQGRHAVLHKEEHAGLPHILGNSVHEGPELIDC